MGETTGHSALAYRKVAAAQLRSQAQYRASFLVELGMLWLFAAAELIEVLVLFRVTDSLGGFSLLQVLFIGTLASCGFAIADLVVGNVERLKFYVRTGLLDAMLIRPRRILPQLLAVDFQFRRVVRVIFNLAVLTIVTVLLDIDWTWWKAMLFVITPITAAVFFAAIFIATATVAFWWIESGEFANSFTYGGQQFTGYPINIYSGAFRAIFAFGLGFAFVGYYPALPILGISDPLGMPSWFAAGGVFVAALASLAASLSWRSGIRHYKGTGS